LANRRPWESSITPGRSPKSFDTLSAQEKKTNIFILAANGDIRNHVLELCEKNNYHPAVATDLEELVRQAKRPQSVIVLLDHEMVNTYGARIYSRINVACPECSVILLCDQANRELIREAMELGAYASILAPYEEWEVLTMIRNILTGKKKRRIKKSRKKPAV
jgi:two-component system response regulator (stage 0 sporulation protein F)